jgi:tetratricopeptide (TPR) repeat protein
MRLFLTLLTLTTLSPTTPGQESAAGAATIRVHGDEAFETRLEGPLAAAAAAMADEDVELAWELLGSILFERHLDEARQRLDGGDAPAALARLDEAQRIRPRDATMLLLRGEALLRLGEDAMAQGQSGLFTLSSFEDALEAYRGAGVNATSRLGMARAAYLLNRSDDAARFARQARARLETEERGAVDRRRPSGLGAERIVADAIYLAYADEAARHIEKLPSADEAREAALFEEASTALDALIASEPESDATWSLGVDLMLFRAAARDDGQARDDALALLERGLERVPTAPRLIDRIADVARGSGGLEASVAALERQLGRARDGLTLMRLGTELFELGMRDFRGADRPAEEYATAVSRFEAAESRLAELPVQGSPDPRRAGDAATAAAWRVVCRLAKGWVRFWEGDLRAASEAFASTEEISPDGLSTYLPDRLSSARVGLENVVARHVEGEDLISAASIADLLHARFPEDVDLANNAGFLNRDAATGLENLAQSYCRAARGESGPGTVERLVAGLDGEPPADDAQRAAAFEREAARLLERAKRTMRRSGNAYLEAARLAPDDVRIQNDTSLIFVYYLHTDLERSEQRLLEAVRLGEAQLTDVSALDAQSLYELENAFGDAHENLGVLHLEHRRDPDAAESWFARAVEIGPDPRPIVSEYWLPRVAAMRAGEPLEPSMVALWGAACE